MEKGNQKIVGLGGKLPVQSTDEFARRFGPSLSRGGIYLRTKKFVAPGTQVLLDLKRADGQSLLRCRGKVEFITGHDGEGTPGLGIRFLELDAASRAVLDAALSGRPGASEDSPPVPNGVGPLHYRLEPARPEPPAGASVLSPREVGELFHVGMPQGQWMPVGEPRREDASQSAAALQSLRQELSHELRALRRQAAWGLAVAVLTVLAAFVGGYLAASRVAPSVASVAVPGTPPVVQQAAVQPPLPFQVAAAAPAEEDPMADFEPAVEEELTAEEAARVQEVISATAERPTRKGTPAPAAARKNPSPVPDAPARKVRDAASPRTSAAARPAPAPALRPALVAAAPILPEEPEVDASEQQLVRSALEAPRGSSCKERMDSLTQLVARTRVPAHREAGILLRARCFSDTWRVEQAHAEFGRYLREFPKGAYAAEASRVLAQ